MTESRPRLTLLSRPGCHLCEDLRETLDASFPGRFDVHESCVDDRPEWKARFGMVIPVLLGDDGAVLCQTHFDPEKVAARYRR